MSWVSSVYECRLCMALTWNASTTIHNLHCCEQPAVEGPQLYKPQVSCFYFNRLRFRSPAMHSGCSFHLLSLSTQGRSKFHKILKCIDFSASQLSLRRLAPRWAWKMTLMKDSQVVQAEHAHLLCKECCVGNDIGIHRQLECEVYKGWHLCIDLPRKLIIV